MAIETDLKSHDQFIRDLKEEAWRVRHCFSEYSFKAMALAGVVLSFIAGFIDKFPAIGFGSIPVILLLIMVARIGTHKFATSNRLNGYVLHLQRTAHLDNDHVRYIRQIGWEEAMKAWRVVQSTTFQNLYTHNKYFGIKPFDCKTPLNKKLKQYRWWEPQALVKHLKVYYPFLDMKDMQWHPGDYLSNMLMVLHTTAIFAMAPLAAAGYFYNQASDNHAPNPWMAAMSWILLSLASLYVVPWIVRNNRRRKILEKELLSIHSCAVMWHAVITAHHRAILALGKKNEDEKIEKATDYKHLTTCLAWLGADLNKKLNDSKYGIEEIHSWIEDDEQCIDRLKTFLKKVDPDRFSDAQTGLTPRSI